MSRSNASRYLAQVSSSTSRPKVGPSRIARALAAYRNRCKLFRERVAADRKSLPVLPPEIAELYDRLLEGKRLTAQLKEVHTCGPITVWRTLNGRIVVIAKTSAPIVHEGSNHQ